MAAQKAMVHRRQFLKIYTLKFCDIWQNFYFYRILNNENFKMVVEQMIFVTHFIITVQLYYYLKTSLLKFGPMSFKWLRLIIVRCVQVYKTGQKCNFRVVVNRPCCHGNCKNVKFYPSTKNFHQYIIHLPSFSSWASTFLLLWFGKWHILRNCQNCVQPS